MSSLARRIALKGSKMPKIPLVPCLRVSRDGPRPDYVPALHFITDKDGNTAGTTRRLEILQ
jgi:hypothetical protein